MGLFVIRSKQILNQHEVLYSLGNVYMDSSRWRINDTFCTLLPRATISSHTYINMRRLSCISTGWDGVMAVRVKGGMSLQNDMWHSLRNDIITRKVIFAEWQRNKLNWKLRPFLVPISSQAAASLIFRARLRWQSESQERLLDFSRSISFFLSNKDSTCLISRAAGSTDTTSRKSAIEGRSHSLLL